MLKLLALWWSTCRIGCRQESTSLWLAASFPLSNQQQAAPFKLMYSVSCFQLMLSPTALLNLTHSVRFWILYWHFVTLCIILSWYNSWIIMLLHQQFKKGQVILELSIKAFKNLINCKHTISMSLCHVFCKQARQYTTYQLLLTSVPNLSLQSVSRVLK